MTCTLVLGSYSTTSRFREGHRTCRVCGGKGAGSLVDRTAEFIIPTQTIFLVLVPTLLPTKYRMHVHGYFVDRRVPETRLPRDAYAHLYPTSCQFREREGVQYQGYRGRSTSSTSDRPACPRIWHPAQASQLENLAVFHRWGRHQRTKQGEVRAEGREEGGVLK